MPLFWLSLAFLGGILAAAWTGLPWIAWLVLAGLAFATLALNRRLPRAFRSLKTPAPPALLLLIFCLGGLRYQASRPGPPTPAEIRFYNDRQTLDSVEGVIIQPPDERDLYTNLRLRVEHIYVQDGLPAVQVGGLLLAQVSPGGNWAYGDRLRLTGELQTPPQDEQFSYRDYLARQDVYSMLSFPRTALVFRGQGSPLLAALYRFKERALAEVYRLFPDPESSLLKEGTQLY
jgi:hypothetical protein